MGKPPDLDNLSTCGSPRKFLVAMGGSEHSFSALRHGIALARARAAALRVLAFHQGIPRATLIFSRGMPMQQFTEDWNRAATQAATRVLLDARRRAFDAGVEASGEVVAAGLTEEIIHKTPGIDMILVGRRVHSLQSSGLGPSVERLVRLVNKPILVAPSCYRPLQRVRVAYAGKAGGDRALVLGLELSASLGIPMEVLTVAPLEERREHWTRATEIIGAGRIKEVHFSGADGDVAEWLLAGSSRRELLVMGAGSRSKIAMLLLGGVTRKVMGQAHGPVMVCKPAPQAR